MAQFQIRYNQTRGKPGRGTVDHVWRVFEDGKEHLARHVRILVPSWSEHDGFNWNIACKGRMEFYQDTDTAVICPMLDWKN